MVRYNLSYEDNGVFQSILIDANSEVDAECLLKEKKSNAIIYGINKATKDDERPGKPILSVK